MFMKAVFKDESLLVIEYSGTLPDVVSVFFVDSWQEVVTISKTDNCIKDSGLEYASIREKYYSRK
ncbi:MAG: hypothetical protein QGI45_17120 [Myxococcota bacterium]|nr:hypothetical protein [Myxococcota bacterium]